jgi:hypothetical protein
LESQFGKVTIEKEKEEEEEEKYEGFPRPGGDFVSTISLSLYVQLTFLSQLVFELFSSCLLTD